MTVAHKKGNNQAMQSSPVDDTKAQHAEVDNYDIDNKYRTFLSLIMEEKKIICIKWSINTQDTGQKNMQEITIKTLGKQDQR